MKQPEALKSM